MLYNVKKPKTRLSPSFKARWKKLSLKIRILVIGVLVVGRQSRKAMRFDKRAKHVEYDFRPTNTA